MRHLLTVLLLLPSLVLAQELHTFKNGEVADADKLNESLQYILNNASGGCSVEQVDNTAEITCADGTTAVVPGYGTVVVYPEGQANPVDTSTFNTGDVVLKDANDVVLGKVLRTDGLTNSVAITEESLPQLGIANWSATNEVLLVSPSSFGPTRTLYFTEANCVGTAFNNNGNYAVVVGETRAIFVPDTTQNYTLLAKSHLKGMYISGDLDLLFDSETECVDGENVVSGAYAYTPWNPPPEILNAAYPVRLEQLP